MYQNSNTWFFYITNNLINYNVNMSFENIINHPFLLIDVLLQKKLICKHLFFLSEILLIL